MLENHELRRPGGVPFGPTFLSVDDDRDRLLDGGTPDPLVVEVGAAEVGACAGVGAADAVWPFACGWPLVGAGFDSADVGFDCVVCWGWAGAGVLTGGDGGFLLILSGNCQHQRVPLRRMSDERVRLSPQAGTAAAGRGGGIDVPFGEACVIQLTSTPWTCSMLGDEDHKKIFVPVSRKEMGKGKEEREV